MICTQCGGQLPDQMRFCPTCGTSTGAQTGIAGSAAQTPLPNAGVTGASAAPALPQTEPTAVISLVLGILSLTIFHFLAGIPAVIVGQSARAKIRANPRKLAGEEMATAGIVMGWISIGLACFVLLVVVVLAIIFVTFGLSKIH
ncbi:MAG TPA: DUF4190 domain-containing protein [Candidatus Saccharimonadales bacterium]|jgi:hypothetical protein|nr:DUF4190 domain-containing protein [Candidatus Saccharimonadales bacterium]